MENVCQKEKGVGQVDKVNKNKAVINYWEYDNINTVKLEMDVVMSYERFFGIWRDFLSTDSKYISRRERTWDFETKTEAKKFINDLFEELNEKGYEVKAIKTTVNVEEYTPE